MTGFPTLVSFLRDGLIAFSAFSKIVAATAAMVDLQLLAQADRDIADDIRTSGNVGYYDVDAAAQRIVKTIDAAAARDAREHAKKTRRIQVFPIGNGLATLAITSTIEQIAKAEKVINAAVDALPVDEDDDRIKDEKRADVAMALIVDPDAEHVGARMVVHVITDGSTLEGGDKPGYLEGRGVIDAGHVRDIANDRDTLIRELDLTKLTDHSTQAADPYRPTALLETVVRGLFGRCSWPGCTRSAWLAELDHVTEYNHADPAAGGQTVLANMNPKCKFHHLLKTFGEGWIDDQIVDANGVLWTQVTSPEGYTVRSRALNTWLMPNVGLIPSGPVSGIEPGHVDRAGEPHRRHTRTEAKHAYRQRIRIQHRRDRESVSDPAPL